MKPPFKGLDMETQLLVAAGAAVAAGCISCLESITAAAAAEEIDHKKLRVAAIIGQHVKDQPAGLMKSKADELLGTHLSAYKAAASCPRYDEAAVRKTGGTFTTTSLCGGG
ncbi:MAG: hypothetical protein AMJ54_12520 [Deltaproteobacteria bacterium SG8_13]|nr:MAG: hypothetical protein AMJ54_12520 [Deltaproteobacteria bacterium SG8_13]